MRFRLDCRCIFLGAVAQMAECWTVDPEGAGSTPVRVASFHDPVGEWLSHEAFNLVIAGSNPVRIPTDR